MSLIPPKRLFHVPSMSTVMYEDVVDDVTEKGYVAVSHVWGEQQPYSADELGINDGVNWEIPLSRKNKMDMLKSAMKKFKMEWCWFDVPTRSGKSASCQRRNPLYGITMLRQS